MSRTGILSAVSALAQQQVRSLFTSNDESIFFFFFFFFLPNLSFKIREV